MKGHIQLGVGADVRDYILIDPMQYHAAPANPMAPRLNTGEKFAELTGWAEWVQADWPGGVGRQDPASNGYLYGDLDSRVSGQLILPPALGATISSALQYGTLRKNRGLFLPAEASAYTTLTLASGGTTGIDTAVYAETDWVSTCVNIFARQSAGGSATIKLYTSEYVATGTLAGDGAPYFAWRNVVWAEPYTFVATGNVLIEIMLVSGTLEVACGYGWGNHATRIYAGGWSSVTYAPLLVTDWTGRKDGIANYYSFVRTSERLLVVAEQTAPLHTLYLGSYNIEANTIGLASTYTLRETDLTITTGNTSTYNGVLAVADGVTITVEDGAALEITDELTTISVTDEDLFMAAPAVQFDQYTYIPVGDGFGKIAADGNGTTETPDASIFSAWVGYLWRATGNDVYYSADGATWTGPVAIGGDDYRVRGLAGLERTVYAATDEGLFYVGDGDITIGISPWGTLVESAVRAVNYEGALCLPVAGRIMRYSAEGAFLDIWVQRADDLPADKLGAPVLLAAMNQWLLAAVNATGDTSSSTVWAWQTEGWHPIATLPPGVLVKALYYDRTLSRLWIGADHGLVFWLHIDDYALNPYNAADSRYMPYGWLETPRFYGDLKKVDKDNESVFVTGEFPTGTSAAIYYQSDQNSTWTLLGTVTADNTELFWSDYTARPTGKWIKVGVLLATSDPAKTAKVKAIVLKYMPMTMDRERWQLPILVSEEQEMVDGSQDTQTKAQKLAHLRGLIRRVAPFTLVDMDGTSYDVKVVGANRSVYQYAPRVGAGDAVVDWIITMSLEQVR